MDETMSRGTISELYELYDNPQAYNETAGDVARDLGVDYDALHAMLDGSVTRYTVSTQTQFENVLRVEARNLILETGQLNNVEE